jgi:hypothetical protein
MWAASSRQFEKDGPVPRELLTVDEIMALLPATVPRLAELTGGLDEGRLYAAPAPGAWSVNDVLAHLRACHDVLGGAILRIVAEDRPGWRRTSPRTWQTKSGYHAWSFGPAFEAFSKQRAELLGVLVPLPPEVWARTAIVTEGPGKVIERSARFYGDWLAGHEGDLMWVV